MNIELDLTVDEIKCLVDYRDEAMTAIKDGIRIYTVQDKLTLKVLKSVAIHQDFYRLFKGG